MLLWDAPGFQSGHQPPESHVGSVPYLFQDLMFSFFKVFHNPDCLWEILKFPNLNGARNLGPESLPIVPTFYLQQKFQETNPKLPEISPATRFKTALCARAN